MLGVLAKPFTGLQMTQLAGELQRLFALRSELRFRSCICVSYFVSLPGRVDPAVWPGSVPNSSRCGFIAKICESAGARNWQPGINRHLQARNMHVSVRGNPTATWNKDLVRPQIARESMLMRAVLKGKNILVNPNYRTHKWRRNLAPFKCVCLPLPWSCNLNFVEEGGGDQKVGWRVKVDSIAGP